VPSVGVVLLAAGDSTRMGEPKQLLQFQGRSLLRRAAEAACESGCSPVVVVLGSNAPQLRREIDDLPVSIVINERWHRGIGSSIKCGVGALNKAVGDSCSVLIMLCDQPLITAAELRRLRAAQAGSAEAVCVSSYAGTVGPPVIVGWQRVPELLELPDEKGAKELWIRSPASVIAVDVPEGATDIDRPEDYQRLTAKDESNRGSLHRQ
jgi:molybdenum cofactor cytidylyltransferase